MTDNPLPVEADEFIHYLAEADYSLFPFLFEADDSLSYPWLRLVTVCPIYD
jgi:hypothetical protein